MFILSAQASVTEALDGSNDTHNGRVVDVEAPGDTGDVRAERVGDDATFELSIKGRE
jgi:hypothetical protein